MSSGVVSSVLVSSGRLRAIFSLEFARIFRGPLPWALMGLLSMVAWGLSTGNAKLIATGSAMVGGREAWISSEFSNAFIFAVSLMTFYSFFLVISAGMAVISDDEARVTELLHSTQLRASEYVWGKFLAVVLAFATVLLFHQLAMIFFNHLIPATQAPEIRGPFELLSYLRPALVFALPNLLFLAGIALYLGERWRQPVMLYLFPLATLMTVGFFFWNWAPSWLDPSVNRLLMLLDPSGFRWLNESWLKVDHGVDFYNTQRVGLDAPFIASRLAFVCLGLVAVWRAARNVEGHLRKSDDGHVKKRLPAEGAVIHSTPSTPSAAAGSPRIRQPLSVLGMRSIVPRFGSSMVHVARVELRRLLGEPAFYLFAFLVVFETLFNSMLQLGPFGSRLLMTPGSLAVNGMGFLTFLLILMLMFYSVESLQQERKARMEALVGSAPMPSSAMLAGKALAMAVVGLGLIAVTFLGCVVGLLMQGRVALDATPFLWVWGLLLVPTLLVWLGFIFAVYALSGSRYLTYGAGLGAFAYTFYHSFTGEMTWVSNWLLWDALRWSDMGAFALDARALWLNRMLVLGLAVAFWAVAVRSYGRRTLDASRLLGRLQPVAILRNLRQLGAYAVVPAVVAVVLWLAVLEGFQGEAAELSRKDYWGQNLATWRDAPQPGLTRVDLDLDIEPQERAFHSRGTYELLNHHPQELARFALTGGVHWRDVSWTVNGETYEPEDRSRLYVFEPESPLRPGESVVVGFDFSGKYPDGVSENGGGTMEFILSSGVHVSSVRPAVAPLVGYEETIGLGEDNQYDARELPQGFHEEILEPVFGGSQAFDTRIRITGPAEYRFNSVGVASAETVEDGRRTIVWESDHPVRLFDVVGGRWQVHQGRETTIYYHPEHAYNVQEMSEVLDASRHFFSEWFYPYPWRELRLSQFPNLDTYAMGVATNIAFSEGIGFLTRADSRVNTVRMVTAHEAAHQWWGNLLTPGKGPGGVVLSEGMSNFSTVLLFEELGGARERMEILKRFEERYSERRRRDAEQSLARTDMSRLGDKAVVYEKGAWVMWMLLRHMGREAMLEGLQHFIETWKDGPDFPVLEDFVVTLRPFAADPEAYDAFVDQWMFEVVVPEYRLSDVHLDPVGERWQVVLRIENVGDGRVPVEVAAVAGERFDDQGQPSPVYRDARGSIILGAGESRELRLWTDFEPQRVVVDPDVQVLQLRRGAAVAKL